MNPEVLKMILAMFGSKEGAGRMPSTSPLAASFMGQPQAQPGQLQLQPSSGEMLPPQQPGQLRLQPATTQQAQQPTSVTGAPPANTTKTQPETHQGWLDKLKHVASADVSGSGGTAEQPIPIPGMRRIPLQKPNLADQFMQLQAGPYGSYGSY